MSGRRWISCLVVVGGVAASALLFRARASAAGGVTLGDVADRVTTGFALAPVPLDLGGKDRNLVGLGSYIVNAQGGCNDCHTAPAYEARHDPFRGGDGQIDATRYLKGGKDFGNGILAPDLTPDAQGRPGGLTLEQFAHSIATGEDTAHPGRILQIMPWPVYRQMLPIDQRAIYEYLRAIPASHAAHAAHAGH